MPIFDLEQSGLALSRSSVPGVLNIESPAAWPPGAGTDCSWPRMRRPILLAESASERSSGELLELLTFEHAAKQRLSIAAVLDELQIGKRSTLVRFTG